MACMWGQHKMDPQTKQKINKLGMLLNLAMAEYNEVLTILANLEAQEIKQLTESKKQNK